MYRKTLAKYLPGEQPGFVSLEGFVDAMVMVEGLKRAGKELTREGLVRGIEAIHQLDLGLRPQLKLDYSARDHAGFSTVIRGGRAVPFEDWKMVKSKKRCFSNPLDCVQEILFHSGFGLVEGVVGRANEGARFNMLETHLRA